MNQNNDTTYDRGFRTTVIIALIAAIFCLSIGYASFSTILQINSISAVSNQSWMIKFTAVSLPTIVGSAKEKSSPVASSTLINFNVELQAPGDMISYTFKIKNSGTIDAKLDSTPSITGIPNDLKEKLVYTLTYEDGTLIKAGDTLLSGSEKSFKLVITYIDDSTIADQTVAATILMTYVQK